ncbi:MAG: 1,4-alpha-glucan branching protein GlgB [Luteitalea sp.]|nr:1,4-alpha-glucan branching protein GlgB [Luteitalea sp.]
MSVTTQLVERALSALVAGANGDPFAVLGPHVSERDGATSVVIRTFQPRAAAVDVIRLDAPAGLPHGQAVRGEERTRVPMTRGLAEGLFEATFPNEGVVFPYRLYVTRPDGRRDEIDDPYRFAPVLGDLDLHLFGEGRHLRVFERLGAHAMVIDGCAGFFFAVWAPNAQRVSVVGDFNNWDGRVHPMRLRIGGGIWELFIPGLVEGRRYKYEIRTRDAAHVFLKADPYGATSEQPPASASLTLGPSHHEWQDTAWIAARAQAGERLDRPMAIYELHLGSWARREDGDYLTYRELATRLVPYAKEMGFTHIELLPVLEHPYAASWGYQVTGFFAPTSRHGTPDDFRAFVDACHQQGIGVILDWVPGHFPKDAPGLARFDGTALYEHEDPRLGEHQDWGTLIFNYGRHEVRNFLLASALYWIEEFHLDGLRVDAVASMLYLDYSRPPGQWLPNKFGGRENLEAVGFLHELNTIVHAKYPGVMTVAEESTAWPGVSRPVHLGGLGFTYKWNMGWMHDILTYMSNDPIHRRWEHNLLTFSMLYAYHENFILPFSHDEVVHGKRSLLDKMPGDSWQKAANLRALYGFMYTHPGKKLLFMGCEFGQWLEWNDDTALPWESVGEPPHAGIQEWVRDLNRLYLDEPALHECDYDPDGFRWIDCHDSDHSIVSFVRRARDERDFLVVVLNLTPVPRYGYRIGVPGAESYREVRNSDGSAYGGGNLGNAGRVVTEAVAAHDYQQSLALTLPPLAALILKPE